MSGELTPLKRPYFVPIVSASSLATTLARKASGKVDGFIVEGPTAGGHNAPPRGAMQLNERGEPVYGPRDNADLEKIRELGLPFWLAGGFAEPGKLQEALSSGAAGIQVGTAFAFCEESGVQPDLKSRVLEMSLDGETEVFTDPSASPTGFPFKVLKVEGTLSDEQVYQERPRLCDLGYLRQAYRRADGSVGHRCSAEPVAQYVQKGGAIADTVGRTCICNALFGTIGLNQVRSDQYTEPAIVTAGDDVQTVARFLKNGKQSYTAADVIRYLLC